MGNETETNQTGSGARGWGRAAFGNAANDIFHYLCSTESEMASLLLVWQSTGKFYRSVKATHSRLNY
jgi:hypothetical protein